jgi:hypothetical protein
MRVAAKEIREAIPSSPVFELGVASYPADCRTAAVLLGKARSRLDMAWDGKTGEVVVVDKG